MFWQVAAGKILADGMARSRKNKILRKYFFGVTFWGNCPGAILQNIFNKEFQSTVK